MYFAFNWRHRDGAIVEFAPGGWYSDDPAKNEWLIAETGRSDSWPIIPSPYLQFLSGKEGCHSVFFPGGLRNKRDLGAADDIQSRVVETSAISAAALARTRGSFGVFFDTSAATLSGFRGDRVIGAWTGRPLHPFNHCRAGYSLNFRGSNRVFSPSQSQPIALFCCAKSKSHRKTRG